MLKCHYLLLRYCYFYSKFILCCGEDNAVRVETVPNVEGEFQIIKVRPEIHFNNWFPLHPFLSPYNGIFIQIRYRN
jgi:hypothetical protein